MKKRFLILSISTLFICNMPCKAQQDSSGLYYELTITTHTTQMDVHNNTKNIPRSFGRHAPGNTNNFTNDGENRYGNYNH